MQISSWADRKNKKERQELTREIKRWHEKCRLSTHESVMFGLRSRKKETLYFDLDNKANIGSREGNR